MRLIWFIETQLSCRAENKKNTAAGTKRCAGGRRYEWRAAKRSFDLVSSDHEVNDRDSWDSRQYEADLYSLEGQAL